MLYVVRSGDTLARIASRHGLSLDELLAMNPQIENADLIRVGETINLSPEPAEPPLTETAAEPEALRPGAVAWFEIAKLEEAEGVDEVRGAEHNPRIVEYHQTTSLKATDDETPWCSSFVNWCIERAGIAGTRSAAARSWLRWGRSLADPLPGCIVVLRRGTNPSQGHVGFYVSGDGNRLLLLGGNQGNRVSISSYPKASLLSFRWPEGRETVPAEEPVERRPAQVSLSPASYNRNAAGKHWNLVDIPVEWSGYGILLRGDLDQDLILDDEETENVDWIAFSEAVDDFQERVGLAPRDGKLGPDTLRRLKEVFNVPSAATLLQLGEDLAFPLAGVPVSEPPGPELVGRTAEEKRICRLWNRYGKAINQQARANNLSTRSALAVFFVESGQAYDGATGLLVIRYEPHVFRRRSGGREVGAERGGQRAEWRNLAKAYAVDKEAALLSCSYGLPQLMGFNWRVTRHASPRDLILAFQRSCEEQVEGFFAFVRANNLMSAIDTENWQAFTRTYNGPGNVAEYSSRLVRALKVIDSLHADGANFEL